MPGNQLVSKIDAYVSTRLRVARLESGETQMSAAEALGISFQQVQKYERGSNRIAAGRLFELARLYGKPIDWFFPKN
jgi:transcriptional regulator with XRE-family HTH domain